MIWNTRVRRGNAGISSLSSQCLRVRLFLFSRISSEESGWLASRFSSLSCQATGVLAYLLALILAVFRGGCSGQGFRSMEGHFRDRF